MTDILDFFRRDNNGRSGNRRGSSEPPNFKQGILGGSIMAVIALVGFICYTSFYRVDASDSGIVLRFGRHVRTDTPGLQIKWPWPVETAYTVPIRRVQSLEFGFRTEQSARRTEYAPQTTQLNDVAEMLTGDLNLAHVEWIVQYRINDAFASLFNIGDESSLAGEFISTINKNGINPAVPDVIRDVSETVVRKLVGDRSVDSVLTMGRETIASIAKIEIQAILDEFEVGVEIITVKLQSTSPPGPVKDAFQEVNRARQNKERVVNEAEGERNQQIPAARGKRDQLISEAEGYRERIVLETTGRVNAFNSKLAEFEKAPEVTMQRLYLEGMQEILNQIGEKTIIDDSIDSMLPILNLNQPSNNPIQRGSK